MPAYSAFLPSRFSDQGNKQKGNIKSANDRSFLWAVKSGDSE
jgi:hypothetical protein